MIHYTFPEYTVIFLCAWSSSWLFIPYHCCVWKANPYFAPNSLREKIFPCAGSSTKTHWSSECLNLVPVIKFSKNNLTDTRGQMCSRKSDSKPSNRRSPPKNNHISTISGLVARGDSQFNKVMFCHSMSWIWFLRGRTDISRNFKLFVE